MKKVMKNGYEIETSEMITSMLKTAFAEQLKDFDVFTHAYVSSRMIRNGHPWVIEARKNGQAAYIILEGYDENDQRNAYLYTGPMTFPLLESPGTSFSAGNYQARLSLDYGDKPVLYWKKIA